MGKLESGVRPGILHHPSGFPDASPATLLRMKDNLQGSRRLPMPVWDNGIPVLNPPPGSVPGTWIGAPRAALWEEENKMLMVVRFRQPEGMGRGGALAIFDSRDGTTFKVDTPIQTITKEQIFDPRYDNEVPASLELASLVRTPSGKWRLYISLGEGSQGRIKQWHMRMMEASAPNEFNPKKQIQILNGNEDRAVKDPSVKLQNGLWYMAAACHLNPLSDPQNADRMYAGYAVSTNGIDWPEPIPVFEGELGTGYARGVRITEYTVNPVTHQIDEAFIDGRPDARHNWFEHTYHIARDEESGLLRATSPNPVLVSPHPGYTPDGELLPDIMQGAARYLCVVPWAEKGKIFSYREVTGPEGINHVQAEVSELLAA